MSPEEKLRLTHIAEAAALIARYVEGISKREFSEDTLGQDAVIRRIQIIGEAVWHFSHELLSKMSDFPAKEATGMRNILVRLCFGASFRSHPVEVKTSVVESVLISLRLAKK